MGEALESPKPDDLKQFSLLVEFDEQDRIDLCELLEPLALKSGKTLFKERDEADVLYLIREGSIRIRSEAAGNLGLLCGGATLGAISLMSIGAREADAVAESDCEFAILTRAGFRRLFEDAPRTACRLAEAVVAELASGLRPNLERVKREFSSDEIVHSG